jgi:hypothetical protein
LSIHAHSKDSLGVSPFNTAELYSEDGFISGERIQALTELTIGSSEITEFHGKENIRSQKHLEIPAPYPHPNLEGFLIHREPSEELIVNSKNSKSIFVYTPLIPYFRYFIAPRIETPFILISHNSDDPVTDKDLELLNHPFLVKWFAQNVEFNHSKLEALPIGLTNIQWGNQKMAELRKAGCSYAKSKNVYANFRHSTHSSRSMLLSSLATIGGVTVREPVLKYNEYIKELASHKFCICPRGNGIDTHRFWESQYVDTIPILLKKDWTPSYSALPILLVDNWEELREINFEESYIKISCKFFSRKSLSMDYYKKLISSVLTEKVMV